MDSTKVDLVLDLRKRIVRAEKALATNRERLWILLIKELTQEEFDEYWRRVYKSEDIDGP